MYDADGYMNVQIQPDRPRQAYSGTPTAEQALEAIRGYTAYFGTYTIDENAQTVTHHREGKLDAGAVDYVTLSNSGLVMTSVYLRVVRNTGSAGSYLLGLSN